MMQQRTWLAIAALALGGCTDLCPGDRSSSVTFAAMTSYRDEITACIRGQGCDQLCSHAFQIDAAIERCVIDAVVRQDGSAQYAPIAPSIDLGSLRGVNVSVTYVEQVTCDSGIDVAGDDSSSDDGWTDDGSSDDGSCDDGSCDDGSDDGSGDDGGGDDGGGDDGGGDDGGGDDGGGDLAPAPTHGTGMARTPPAATSTHQAHRIRAVAGAH